jgi:hypothetical protein
VGVSTAVGNGNVTIVFLSFTHAKGPNMGRFVLNTATGASTMYFSVKQQLQYLLTQRKLPINNTPPTVANIMRNVAHVDIITIDPLLAGAAGRGAGGGAGFWVTTAVAIVVVVVAPAMETPADWKAVVIVVAAKG